MLENGGSKFAREEKDIVPKEAGGQKDPTGLFHQKENHREIRPRGEGRPEQPPHRRGHPPEKPGAGCGALCLRHFAGLLGAYPRRQPVALGPRRHLGAVRQLGAAVARADDLRGRHHRHGEAQGLHQRQGVDDRGGHCAVLRHRLYLWQAGYSRWPKLLGVHSTPLHGKRRDWRRCAGRPAGPAHGAGRRAGGRQDYRGAAALCGGDGPHRHHPAGAVPHHQAAGGHGQRGH